MNKIFYISFILIFLLMGILQFLGLSITMLSYSLIVLLCFMLLSFLLIKKKITINSFIIINFCLLTWISISGIINQTKPILIINYFSFVIIPVAIYLLVKAINKTPLKINFLINTVIIIQLPVLCLQYFLPDYIMYSQKAISFIDRMFGTFPLSADHFLSFFLIMNIIYIGIKKAALTFFDYFIIIYSILCISLTNSVTSYMLLILTLAYIFFLRSNIYIKIPSVIISILVLVFAYFNIYEVLGLLQKPELLDMTNVKYIEDGSAGRIQTFFYVFSSDLSIFGNGPSAYFNPFLGEFQLNLNFSQLLWFYYDLGVIGVIFPILLIYSFLFSFNISNHLRIYLFFLVLAYSFSSTIFDQFAFLLTLNIFVSLMENKQIEDIQ